MSLSYYALQEQAMAMHKIKTAVWQSQFMADKSYYPADIVTGSGKFVHEWPCVKREGH